MSMHWFVLSISLLASLPPPSLPTISLACSGVMAFPLVQTTKASSKTSFPSLISRLSPSLKGERRGEGEREGGKT